MTIKDISIIGLGSMGTPIATSLLKAGYQLKGFDIAKKKMSSLAPLGLKPNESLRETVSGADLIILSLPNWEVVHEVVEGEKGILWALKKGQIIIDTSTVPPWETECMGRRLLKKGIEWMDVPISGAASEAEEGNLVFMVGGKRSAFNRIKPVLDRVGKKTVYVGKNGQAAMLKLIVNHTLFLNQAAAVEGLTLSLKAGLNPEVVFDVMISGAARSDLIASRGQDMLMGNFGAKGALAIAVKDIEICIENAKRLGVAVPMGVLYQQFLLSAYRKGWEQMDATIVMRIYEELSGIRKGISKI